MKAYEAGKGAIITPKEPVPGLKLTMGNPYEVVFWDHYGHDQGCIQIYDDHNDKRKDIYKYIERFDAYKSTDPVELKEKEHKVIMQAKLPSPYHREIKPGVIVDAYDILSAYGTVCPAVDHALKKLLCLGKRSGGKSYEQDIKEAIWSLERALELHKEKESWLQAIPPKNIEQ